MDHAICLALGAALFWLGQNLLRRLPDWHRRAFGFYWRWRSRHRGGRPQLDHGLIELIRRISLENPL